MFHIARHLESLGKGKLQRNMISFMVLTMRKGSVAVNEGDKFGLITVGMLVFNVQDHPLYLTTPTSYLQHGRLRECECECGEVVLYSENVLSSGQIKSCGCLRRLKREAMHQERESREKRKANRREILYRISQAQARLKFLQSRPIHLRNTPENNKEMDNLAAELRKLFALKGHANRKETPKETWRKRLEEE